MTSILMVCLGNICRSPVAEGILRHLAKEKGIAIKTDSAGTASYHIGEAPDPRSQKNALKNGVCINDLRARQFTRDDFDRFDFIFVMDNNNYKDVMRLARSESDKSKVKLLLDVLYKGEHAAVPDPYYGDEKRFQEVFEICKQACEKIISNLEYYKNNSL